MVDPRMSTDPSVIEVLDEVFYDPHSSGVPYRTVEEIDAAQLHGQPQFEDHPPSGRFFKDESRKASVLPPKRMREGVPLGENVVLPKHYARFQIEPIKFIGENKLNFFQGNVVKYILRHDAKNGIEDVRKAQRYARMYELFLLGNPEWAGPDPRDKELNEKFEAIFMGFRELLHQHVMDPKERAEVLKGIVKLEASHAVSKPA